jgi:hypothetical protein
MFATHNLGLARASSELIYSVQVADDNLRKVTPLESIPNLSEFLGELSFSGYQELGFTKLLLVEGSSEVITVQQLLRKFKKDHQIVILPLGGGSLINANSERELSEIMRITTEIYALIDSERNKAPDQHGDSLPKDRLDFQQLCQKIGIVCHVLGRRALENYFSTRAIRQVKGSDKYQMLDPYQKLEEADHGWGKAENWKIAREMDKSELENTDLYDFLKNRL